MSSSFPDDTALDAIAAQVRSLSPVSEDEVGALLVESRMVPGGSATARLIELQLATVLDAVLARRSPTLDLMDLYQEGSVAATVAVTEYASRGGQPAGLRAYVQRVVDRFLDEVVEREEAQRVADALLVENAKLYEAAEVVLRGRLEREPTRLELAAALNWTPEAVDLIGDSVRLAREQYDAEIVQYLDDADDDDEGDGTGSN